MALDGGMTIQDAVAPPPARFYVLTLPNEQTQAKVHHIIEMWREMMGGIPLLVLPAGGRLDADPHAEALLLLRELVEATDAGADTYQVTDIVTKAREMLGIPKPW